MLGPDAEAIANAWGWRLSQSGSSSLATEYADSTEHAETTVRTTVSLSALDVSVLVRDATECDQRAQDGEE